MSITEALMDPGDFRVTLRVDAPHFLDPDSDQFIAEWGHVVIVPQYVGDPKGFTDASLLAAARYTGVVLEPEWANGQLTIYGAGLDVHLGDDSNSIGPRLESGYSFSAATLSTALSGMLPAVLDAGSIQASGSYSGSHQDQTSKTAIKALMRSLDAMYRINPDGTVDAEITGTGSVFVETPTVMAVRINTGSDALLTGVPAQELTSRRKGRDYATRLLVGSEGSNTGVSRSSVPYYGLNGSALSRVGLDSGDGASSASDFAAGWLADHDVQTEEQIRLDQYEVVSVSGGSGVIQPGDNVYVWDPASGFVDSANAPVWFRGECTAPIALRVAEVEWPVVEGMGIYYRPSLAAVTVDDWIDLTPHVEWEQSRRDAPSLLRVLDGAA